ncbi:MAG: divalent metal cation transporter, partial [Bacteroidota bacterium]
LCAGQSSTITGTLAGQIVMEGYLDLRIAPWIRRLITRLIAIAPAVLVIHYKGEEHTGDLLILSQVILSLQLGFAVIPLIHFVSDREKMGTFTISLLTRVAAWLCALIIVSLNVKLVAGQLGEWLQAEASPWLVYGVVPFALFCGLMLLYITFAPWVRRRKEKSLTGPHPATPASLQLRTRQAPRRIALCLDFGSTDQAVIQQAIDQGGTSATYLLIHITESAGAHWSGTTSADLESARDLEQLSLYAQLLNAKGYSTELHPGYGRPAMRIPEIVETQTADLLVMGAHGHRALMDFLLGSTVDSVRHKVRIPVLIVRD